MTAPSAVGQRLKAERERLGIGRVAVTRATGIYVHHLAALEYGRFEDLPGNVIEPWVRAYADHLGLDGDALVADLRRERGPFDAAPASPVARDAPEGRRSPVPLGIAIAAAALLVVAAAVGWGTRNRREPGPARAEPPAPVVRGKTPPSPSAPAPPAAEVLSPSLPAAPPGTPSPPLSVAEHGVGRGVVDHRLAGTSDRFEEGTEVWFWTDVRGGAAGGTVRHVWLRGGRVVLAVPLRLGGARWRTQSSLVLPPGSDGEWGVEARDGAGHVLARDTFRCVGR